MASYIVGIDIGSYAVKVAVVDSGLRKATVVKQLQFPRRIDAESPDADIADLIAEVAAEHNMAHDTVFLALGGDRVFFSQVEFGFIGKKRGELDAAVGSEIEQVLPLELEDMVYAFESIALSPQASAGPAITRLLACAAEKQLVRDAIDWLEPHHASPRSLLPAPLVYAPLLVQENIALTEPIAVVDIGHAKTNFTLLVDGKPVYCRVFSRGGRNVTDAIARTWQIGWPEAEKAKHQDGFVESRLEPARGEAWQRISAVLTEELGPLARELRQTINACQSKTGFAPRTICLTGGASRLRGLPSYLSEHIGISCTRLAEATAETADTIDFFSVALGTALCGLENKPSFDLRQGEFAQKTDLSFLRRKAPFLAASALAIVGLAAVSGYAKLHRLRKTETALTERLAAQSIQTLGVNLSAQEVLARAAPAPTTSLIPKHTAYDLFRDVNTAMPAKTDATLDIRRVEIRPGKVTLEGKASPTGEKDALSGIKQLTDLLKAKDCFKDVPEPESQPGPEGTRTFTLSLKTECL